MEGANQYPLQGPLRQNDSRKGLEGNRRRHGGLFPGWPRRGTLARPGEMGEGVFRVLGRVGVQVGPTCERFQLESRKRIPAVHELKVQEFGQVRFKQRNTMLGRYIPLDTPSWLKRRKPLLPIAKVIVGPGNHPAFTSISVRLLLDQMGYENVPVDTTKVSLQRV